MAGSRPSKASVKAMVALCHERLGHGHIEVVAGGDHITTPGNPEFGRILEDFLRAHQQKKGGD